MTRSEEAVFTCGFSVLGVVVVVLQLLERRLRLAVWLYVEDAQWSVFPADGSSSSCVAPLELLDDGREFGVQRWPASFGPCSWA